MRFTCVIVLSAAISVTGSALSAQHDAGAGHAHRGKSAPTLGTIVFPNSGNAAAQEPFLRGVALLHSFEYDEAADAFRAAQRADPTLALAYWGEALTYSHVLWGRENLPASRAVLQRLAPTPAERLAKARTPRERGFGAAVEAFFTDGPLAQRVRAYSDSLRRHAQTANDDQEAAAFASHAIMLASFRGDAQDRDVLRREAVALARRVVAVNPKHPGATHYLIHLYDSPQMAADGLAFARSYDQIAPDAEHALHMPSHIYLQLGLWNDVARSNERAWAASRATTPNVGQLDWHAYSWLHYAYLQQGRWTAAAALVDSARTQLADTSGGYTDANFVISRLEFQHAAETGRWDRRVTRPRGSVAQDVSDRDRAFRQFANYWLAVDAAMRGDTAFRSVAAPYLAIADSVRGGGGTTRSPVLSANALVVEALVAKAAGDTPKALAGLQAATELERKFGAFVGPPERVFAAELWFLEVRRDGDDAAASFLRGPQGAELLGGLENVLRICPNRSQTLLLLVRARRLAGDTAGSAKALDQLRANWHSADQELLQRAGIKK